VSADVQLQRLMLRDRCSLDAAEAMIAAQAPRAARLAIAHDVLDNDGDLSMLDAPVARLHALYSRSRSSSSAAAS
jgi:dephospho-CoA kinase